MKTILAWTALAAALAAPLGAGAAGTASASAGNTGFGVELIDLDPLDGVTPSIVFRDTGMDSSVTISAYDYLHPAGDGGRVQGRFEKLERNWPTGTLFAETGPRVAAAATQATQDDTTFMASAFLNTVFDLSPHTAAVFSIPYTVVLDLTPGSSGSSSFYVGASMGGAFWFSGYDSLSGAPGSNSGIMSGRMETGGTGMSGIITLSASSYASTPHTVPGVPEPGSYAMLLAGLGIVGAWRRRQSNT